MDDGRGRVFFDGEGVLPARGMDGEVPLSTRKTRPYA